MLYILVILKSVVGVYVELSERERLMLVEKKEEIRKLTIEILDMASNPENELEIKKKLISIISLLSTIASYSSSKNVDLDAYTKFIQLIFSCMSEKLWFLSEMLIEIACNYANAVRFDFTKKNVEIHLPPINIFIQNKYSK
jgi:hypothetical protein